MAKDPRRYTPQPYGHAAPWSRPSPPAPAVAPAAGSVPARSSRRWSWALLLAVAVAAAIGWLVWDSAIG